MMRDEIFTLESFKTSCGDLIGMDSLEDHKGFGVLHPQFLWSRTAAALTTWKQFETLSNLSVSGIGVQANFFKGAESSLPWKKFSTAPEKNCYANLQNYFARLTPPSNY